MYVCACVCVCVINGKYLAKCVPPVYYHHIFLFYTVT